MSRINCKLCGCPNEVKEGQTTIICEACGTEQTISNLDSERKTNLFNRANAARLKNEFDKAIANYETILSDYPTDAEAHWGLVLCKYGIEYVDDPKTKKKIPTCHRTLYTSIYDDLDYKEAIDNADVVAKRLYQTEAEEIERLQKSILAISQQEEPYDIFICYKETDDNGERTRDSFVAEDIYKELVAKDYKVFYSRITLESKLGKQYEPIIFAALQSSKVMIVIGSKREYFESAWVKNEWSRYLSFMNETTGKYMIPCYRDMEAYDMPDEFLSLQSQNLDRLGAKQDLLRVIDKVFNKEVETYNQRKSQTNIVNGVNIESLLKRCNVLIENKCYDIARNIIQNKILNINPECAEAYADLLLCDFQTTLTKLQREPQLLFNNKHYQEILGLGDEKLMETYKKINDEACEQIYNNTLSLLNENYVSLYTLKQCETNLLKLKEAKDDFKDVQEKLKIVQEKIKEETKPLEDLTTKEYEWFSNDRYIIYKTNSFSIDFIEQEGKYSAITGYKRGKIIKHDNFNYEDITSIMDNQKNQKLEITFRNNKSLIISYERRSKAQILKFVDDIQNRLNLIESKYETNIQAKEILKKLNKQMYIVLLIVVGIIVLYGIIGAFLSNL